jgi:hypothetical protein
MFEPARLHHNSHLLMSPSQLNVKTLSYSRPFLVGTFLSIGISRAIHLKSAFFQLGLKRSEIPDACLYKVQG